jgi:hypothetical protein
VNDLGYILFGLPDYVLHPFSGDYRNLEDVSVRLDVENQGQSTLFGDFSTRRLGT